MGRPDGRSDKRADIAATEVDAESREQPARDQCANNADEQVANIAKPTAAHYLAGKPAGNDADDDKDDDVFDVHFSGLPLRNSSAL